MVNGHTSIGLICLEQILNKDSHQPCDPNTLNISISVVLNTLCEVEVDTAHEILVFSISSGLGCAVHDI